MDIRSIVLRMGGAATVARGIGLPGNGVGALRVRAWVNRGRIPGAYWGPIAAYSKEQGLGVTLEVLAAAHVAPTVAEAA